jgi:WD40 repeat protein
MQDALSALDPTIERSFRGSKSTVRAVAFDPSLKQVAAGGDDGVVKVFNFKAELRAFTFKGHTKAITDVQVRWQQWLALKHQFCFLIRDAPAIFHL